MFAVLHSRNDALIGRRMLPVSALDYRLPEDRIATRPAEPRDASRLMVVSRTDVSRLEHARFSDLPAFLEPGDRLIFNTSGVAPARLRGRRAGTGGKIEGLFLRALGRRRWLVMLHSGGRLVEGDVIGLASGAEGAALWSLILERKQADAWEARLEGPPASARISAADALDAVGATPLPPYILKARAHAAQSVEDELDRAWYQTVYAKAGSRGSVAAPTAGLHFTPTLLDALKARRVDSSEVCLEVGPGTFQPVKTPAFEQHSMHDEAFSVPSRTIEQAGRTRREGGRIIAVGTTVVRAMESLPRPMPDSLQAGGYSGSTRLLITPGFSFAWTDALITNFHLPRSTLLALVAAFLSQTGASGVDRVLNLYRKAIAEGYRFYSYGDAMLILP